MEFFLSKTQTPSEEKYTVHLVSWKKSNTANNKEQEESNNNYYCDSQYFLDIYSI